eukprot:2008876-Prymnesium_polylepis.2
MSDGASSVKLTIKFSGFTSRCATPNECSTTSACISCLVRARARASGSAPCSLRTCARIKPSSNPGNQGMRQSGNRAIGQSGSQARRAR